MELGGWASCTGLRVDFKLKEILEGGTNGHACYVPDRISYPRVTLTRAMTADDSPKVAQWLATYVDKASGGTAEITLNDARGTRIASWTLHNVLPGVVEGTGSGRAERQGGHGDAGARARGLSARRA